MADRSNISGGAWLLKFLAVALVVVAGAAGCAPRRPPPFGGPPGGEAGFRGGLIAQPIALVFVDFDADRDQCTTSAEVALGADANWRVLDADGDGAGSPIEFSDWALLAMGSAQPTPGRFAFDRDASGSISQREFLAQLEMEFGRLDADKNGCVTRAELVELVEPRGGMGAGPPGGGAGRRPGGPGGGGPPGGPPGGGFPGG